MSVKRKSKPMDETKYNNAKDKIEANETLQKKFERVEKIKSELNKIDIIDNFGVSVFDAKDPNKPSVTIDNNFALNIAESIKTSLSNKANNLLDEILNNG